MLTHHTLPRRAVTLPGLLLVIAVTAALLPVVLLADGIWWLRRGGRARAARLGLLFAVYLAAEVTGLTRGAWLWVRWRWPRRSRREETEAYHDATYQLLATLLGRLHRAAVRLFRLEIDARPAGGAPGPGPGPALVLSRHAGPGDSFLLLYALIARAGRRPRIVLKRTLVFDPAIDVLVGRVPHLFVDSGRSDEAAREIGRLASGMGPADALVIFPEGGNFTPDRRRRVIERLRRRRRFRAAERAARLRNLLPPHPAGVCAALDAAPEADVVFVAHTGLDHMDSCGAVWRGLPLTRPVEAAWWTVRAADVPDGEQARRSWLDGNWARIDAWITEHRAAPDSP